MNPTEQHQMVVHSKARALSATIHELLAKRPETHKPTLLEATPGLGKTRSFAQVAAQRILDYFQACIQKKSQSEEQFWSQYPPLYYLARTIGELAETKRTIQTALEERARHHPEFSHWLHGRENDLLVIAPTHLTEADARDRQKQTGEPDLVLFTPHQPHPISLPPDWCHRAEMAQDLIANQYHTLSQHLCRRCPSAHGSAPCGTRNQLHRALNAPVVLSTANRLSSPEDRLRYLHLADRTRIPRSGFVDDYSEPLLHTHILHTSQLDTWDWQLQQKKEQIIAARSELDKTLERLRTGPKATGRAPRKSESETPQTPPPDPAALAKIQKEIDQLDRTVAAITSLHRIWIPNLRTLYTLAARRLSRWHHAAPGTESPFLPLAGMVPMTRFTHRAWRATQNDWRAQCASLHLPEEATLAKFLRDESARLLDQPDPVSEHLGLLPGAQIEPMLTALEQGVFSAAWSESGYRREVVLQATFVRPIWQRIQALGYLVSDATPDRQVARFLGNHLRITAPLHPQSRLNWVHNASLTKDHLQRSLFERKKLGHQMLSWFAYHADQRHRPQAVITHHAFQQTLHTLQPALPVAYFGGGGQQGHRAHNAFVQHDLHILGIPRLSPQSVAQQVVLYRQMARQHASLRADLPPVQCGTQRPEHASRDGLGKTGTLMGMPEFLDPLASELARTFTERELVQAIHRTRAIHHPVVVTIQAPAVTCDLSPYGLPNPVFSPSLADVRRTGFFVSLPDGDSLDVRVVTALATPSAWSARDPRGRGRPYEILADLPSMACILQGITEKTGSVLHSHALREQLVRVSRFARDHGLSAKELWRWCCRTLRRLNRKARPLGEVDLSVSTFLLEQRVRYWAQRQGRLAQRRRQQWTFLLSLFTAAPAAPPN